MMVGYSKEWLEHMAQAEVESGVDICIGPPVALCIFCDVGVETEIVRAGMYCMRCKDCGSLYVNEEQFKKNVALYRVNVAASRLALDALNARDADVKRWYS